jgi:type VI secretion system ImpH/TssG family protein
VSAATGDSSQATGFLSLSRQLEAESPNRSRIGKAPKPSLEIARYGQDAHFGIAPSSINGIRTSKQGIARIRVRFMGLTGPMGALPLHLTEYAQQERLYGRASPFSDFLDLLTDRPVQLFYRAWADADAPANHDRPNDDRFEDKVRAIGGLARVDSKQAGSLPRAALASFAGLAGGRQSRAAVEGALCAIIGLPVSVDQFMPFWLRIEPEDRTQLGRLGTAQVLGRSAVLGSQVQTVQDSVRVRIRVDREQDFKSLLPGGAFHERTMDAIRFALPGHLMWDATLESPEVNLPAAKLSSGTRLGWTSWMKPMRSTKIRGDVRLRPGMARRMMRQG